MEKVVTLQNKEYPILLKDIGKDAPKKLYYKGEWDEGIFENCLAVVGSRSLTTYGRQVIRQIVGELAAAGITIVSGFMYGGDAAAHHRALKVGGRTIAVMPCGINLIHPEHQQDLYFEILNNGGLVISEYEGEMQPVNWTYPQRNRIVAGLSQATLVVEAGERSGTLITANFAKKFGRKVFAVPGPITSEVSKGTLRLLKEGAEMVTSAKDILDFYKIESLNLKQKASMPNLDKLEKEILEQLQREPLAVDDMARIFNMPVFQISTTLSLMQLKGIIKEEGNKYYVN